MISNETLTLDSLYFCFLVIRADELSCKRPVDCDNRSSSEGLDTGRVEEIASQIKRDFVNLEACRRWA